MSGINLILIFDEEKVGSYLREQADGWMDLVSDIMDSTYVVRAHTSGLTLEIDPRTRCGC